jgi:streptogramin lyase
VVSETLVPTADSYPDAIAAGPDGNVWFTERSGDKIGRITPAGEITEFPVPTAGHHAPMDIAAGPDGNLWFTEDNSVGGFQIGRITPAGVISEFPLPAGPTDAPLFTRLAIAAGPDGNLWVTLGYAGGPCGADTPCVLVRVAPTGAVTTVPYYLGLHPEDAIPPGEIAAGPDGNMWVQGSAVADLMRMTPAGAATFYSLGDDPTDIYRHIGTDQLAAGPDGNMWFTDVGANMIGFFIPPAAAAASAAPTNPASTGTPAVPPTATVTATPHKAPATPSVHEVAHTTNLAGGSTGSVEATCPEGERALGGGWSVPAAQARVFAARESGGAWSVSVQPLGHPASTAVTVYVECLADAPRAVVTQRSASGSVPANASGVVVAACTSGETLVGGGFDLSAAPTTLELRADAPQTPESGVSWAVAAMNRDAAAQPVTAYAECLANVRAAPTYPGQRGTYVYASQTGDVAVACPAGAVPAGGGLDYTAQSIGNLYLLQATATGWHGAIYGVTGSGLISLVPTAWAVCLHFAVQP